MYQPKKLYKCISFKKSYCYYIYMDMVIRFATIAELAQGNDELEFQHLWDADSWVFESLGAELKNHYTKHFKNTAILSVSKSPKRAAWEEYCSKSGGVRYEFSYDPSHFEVSGMNTNHVKYNDNKKNNLNLPLYLYEKEMLPRVRRLLKRKLMPQAEDDQKKIMRWLESRRIQSNTLSHILNEIVFKKIRKFKFEDEFRFVHLFKSVDGKPLKLDLQKQFVDFRKIGLKLERISTSNVEKVKSDLGNPDIEIIKIYFDD